MRTFFALLAGAVFGIGIGLILILSRMADPAKVLGFLYLPATGIRRQHSS